MNKKSKIKRKLFLRKIVNDKCEGIRGIIVIEKEKDIGHNDFVIEEKLDNESYKLGLSATASCMEPLNQIRWNQIQWNPLPDILNKKPKPINLSTVLKIKNEENNAVYIYWSTPQDSFGDISYKIINRSERKKIDLIPFKIELPAKFTSFQVVTRSEIDGRVYESDPSKKISIDDIMGEGVLYSFDIVK